MYKSRISHQDIDQLRAAIAAIGRARMYIDVPDDLKDELLNGDGSEVGKELVWSEYIWSGSFIADLFC